MIGFVNIYKDSGCGSTYAVGKVKRKLNVKCGHMGTLDPLASGVLPVGICLLARIKNNVCPLPRKGAEEKV